MVVLSGESVCFSKTVENIVPELSGGWKYAHLFGAIYQCGSKFLMAGIFDQAFLKFLVDDLC
jgi:hypothetical protein